MSTKFEIKKKIHLVPTQMGGARLLSLDFMRGLIMFLLALEACELYVHIRRSTTNHDGFGFQIIRQFFHNRWQGLHFWDLVQPAFMFMAGIAMAYSLTKQIEKGISWKERFVKILKRSGWLLFWGLFKRISSPDWFALDALDVTDILTQLAFVSIIAFLLFNLSIRNLIVSCIAILLLTECLYRFWNVPGYDQGYTDGKNFGNWVDWILFRRQSSGYVFINWLPTAVHTVAGVIVGKIFLKNINPIKILLGAALGILLIGYGLDKTNITPIIKPIATSSFVLASLGYCLLMVTVFYWWIDVRKYRRGLLFFQVLGMNSIFIYLFFDIVGRLWLNEYTLMVVSPVFQVFNLGQPATLVLASLCTFAVEWLICYFLYKKKIFFKL
ncbi:DUF5009 domain-containing protein [Chitinophagaceae bacterium 26-R-25]|nr:DUF5009 domain-containing protein [Chitinophagaceae bacterium 26-R-25]